MNSLATRRTPEYGDYSPYEVGGSASVPANRKRHILSWSNLLLKFRKMQAVLHFKKIQDSLSEVELMKSGKLPKKSLDQLLDEL